MNKAWAQGTLAGLVFTMVLVAILTVVLRRRPCNLDGEPNSIAAALRLLYHSPDLCRKMENSEFHPPRKIQEVLDGGDERYKLELVPGEGPRIRVFGGGDGRSSKELLPPPEETYFPSAYNQKPWALRMVPGVSFLTCFILVTLILIATFSYARTHDGKTHPFQGPFYYSGTNECTPLNSRYPHAWLDQFLCVQVFIQLSPSCGWYGYRAGPRYSRRLSRNDRPIPCTYTRKSLCISITHN